MLWNTLWLILILLLCLACVWFKYSISHREKNKRAPERESFTIEVLTEKVKTRYMSSVIVNWLMPDCMKKNIVEELISVPRCVRRLKVVYQEA